MNKQIVGPILGIVLCSLSFAMYAGDCIQVNLSELESLDNVGYTAVGNSSNLNGLTIEINNTIANVCTEINYKPDSFTLIFMDMSTKEIIKEVPVYRGGSSGGSRTKTVIEEVIKEVPTYIDREVINETIIYTDPEIIEVEKDDVSILKMIFLLCTSVFGILLVILTIYTLKKYIREHKENEHKK